MLTHSFYPSLSKFLPLLDSLLISHSRPCEIRWFVEEGGEDKCEYREKVVDCSVKYAWMGDNWREWGTEGRKATFRRRKEVDGDGG